MLPMREAEDNQNILLILKDLLKMYKEDIRKRLRKP